MRILYYYSSQQYDTGSPRALVGLIEQLDRTAYEPLFWATRQGPLVDELARRGVRIVQGDAGSVAYRRPFHGMREVIGKAAALRRLGIDLLHVNEFGWNLDLVLGAALARVPVVLHVHNPMSIDRQNLHRFIARCILLVSEAHAGAVEHFDRIRHKSAVLHNPVDLARFAGGKSIRLELGLGGADLVVGTIAQLTPNKGIDTLLETARLLLPRWPRLQFVVIGRAGKGHEAFGREMMARADDPRFEGRVRFLGARADIPDLLASMDLFFLPTRGETFGIAVVEAMAAGVPVVVGRVGGIAEIVPSPDVGCAVADASAERYAAVIDGLLAEPERRRELGARGRASLVGRFDQETFTRRLTQVYQAAANGTSACFS